MTDNKNNKSKFPIFKIVYESFGIFFNNFKSAVVMGSIFSLIFMVLKVIGGQSIFCYNDNFKETFICSNNFIVFFLAHLLLWFGACIYIRNWYRSVILKSYKFSIKDMFPQITDVKILGILGVFVVSILITASSGFMLFIREANPNIVIELAYFSVISIGFFAPFFTIPVFSYISFVSEGEKLPNIKELWQLSKGNFAIMFISFSVIMMIVFLIMMNITNYLVAISINGNIFVIVMAEFLYNIVLMFMLSIYTNYCYMQKKFLFERI